MDWSRTIWVVSVLGLAGCAAPTAILLRVDTELTVPTEIDAVEVTIEGRTARATLTAGGPLLPYELELRPGDRGLGPFEARVVGLLGGAPVVSITQTLLFERGRTLLVEVDLTVACDNAMCGVGERCVDGICLAPPRDGGPEERDGGGRDAGPGDGGPRDGGPRDAGPQDAGPRDAGPRDAGPGDACVARTETCDATDEDCDGRIDEGGACPCTVVERGGHVYQLCIGARAWNDARTRCVERGYDLVIVDDAEENAWLSTQLAAHADSRWWIGFTDATTEREWVWVDGRVGWSGGASIGYTNWVSGDPSGPDQDCAMLETDSGRWRDLRCFQDRQFVCETR